MAYANAFHHFKPDKHLRWLQHLGTADITVSLKDRELRLQVTTLQASLIELFEGEEAWTIEGLGEKLGADEDSIRAALGFWAGHGVLSEREKGDSWVLIEGAGEREGGEAGEGAREEVGEESGAQVEPDPGHAIKDVNMDRVNNLARLWKVSTPLSSDCQA